MRPKRPLRGGLPGFNLNLPSQAKTAEVHVEQKAQDDVNRLFIDVDDTIESPMITTEPQFSAASLPVNAPGSASTTASNAPKFIHVHNTNIFVLVDGISMFLDGKSTFTGENDQLVSQHLQSKQRDRNLARQQEEERARVLGLSASVNGLDSVEVAIRNIERTAGTLYCDPPAGSPPVSTSSSPYMGPAAAMSGAVMSPTTAPTTTAPPDDFSSLFSTAKKPSRPPLFRSATAAALDTLASSMSSPQGAPATDPPPRMRLPSSASCGVLTQKSFEQAIRTAHTPLGAETTVGGRPAGAGTAGTTLSHYPSLMTDGSSSSLASLASTVRSEAGGRRKGAREKPVTVDDIGHSNKTLDLDTVQFLQLIGTGAQGKVYRVRLDTKLYALKRIDVNEALEATNNVERQGRKKGLVKELHAIQMQSERPAPHHLMQMFNAVVVMEQSQLQLSILMELMSLGVEDIKNMAARLPASHVLANTQATFKGAFSGSRSYDGEAKKVCDGYKLTSRKVLGRKKYDVMENWEAVYERQTALPEIVLAMLAADILCGLRELHNDYHLVHCDLKPANVLLSFDRQHFKLADFGCACVIDEATQEVRRSGVDLGSKLYKAPERLGGCTDDSEGYLDDDEHGGSSDAIVFSGKADVWSLGILLLELCNGAHPCVPFKDNFWDYNNKLNLRNMLKPQNWSPLFSDFIMRCLMSNPEERASVAELLKHPFIAKYAGVPRTKLKTFVDKLEVNAWQYQREEKKKLLEAQILASTVQSSNVDTIQSRINWSGYTSHLRTAPSLQDLKSFPKLE